MFSLDFSDAAYHSNLDGEGNLSSHDLSHIVNCLRRDPIPAQLLASIKVPCLIIHGDADKHASPLSAAEAWQKSLTSGTVL